MVFMAMVLRCFSSVVVAGDPYYFNNNQWAWQAAVFGRRVVGWVAGWLWRFLQAVYRPHFAKEFPSCLID